MSLEYQYVSHHADNDLLLSLRPVRLIEYDSLSGNQLKTLTAAYKKAEMAWSGAFRVIVGDVEGKRVSVRPSSFEKMYREFCSLVEVKEMGFTISDIDAPGLSNPSSSDLSRPATAKLVHWLDDHHPGIDIEGLIDDPTIATISPLIVNFFWDWIKMTDEIPVMRYQEEEAMSRTKQRFREVLEMKPICFGDRDEWRRVEERGITKEDIDGFFSKIGQCLKMGHLDGRMGGDLAGLMFWYRRFCGNRSESKAVDKQGQHIDIDDDRPGEIFKHTLTDEAKKMFEHIEDWCGGEGVGEKAMKAYENLLEALKGHGGEKELGETVLEASRKEHLLANVAPPSSPGVVRTPLPTNGFKQRSTNLDTIASHHPRSSTVPASFPQVSPTIPADFSSSPMYSDGSSFASCQSTPGTTPFGLPDTGVAEPLLSSKDAAGQGDQGKGMDRFDDALKISPPPSLEQIHLEELLKSPAIKDILPELLLLMESRSNEAKRSCQWLARRILASHLFDRGTFDCVHSWMGSLTSDSLASAIDESLPLLLCITAATSDHTDEQPWLDDERIAKLSRDGVRRRNSAGIDMENPREPVLPLIFPINPKDPAEFSLSDRWPRAGDELSASRHRGLRQAPRSVSELTDIFRILIPSPLNIPSHGRYNGIASQESLVIRFDGTPLGAIGPSRKLLSLSPGAARGMTDVRYEVISMSMPACFRVRRSVDMGIVQGGEGERDDKTSKLTWSEECASNLKQLLIGPYGERSAADRVAVASLKKFLKGMQGLMPEIVMEMEGERVKGVEGRSESSKLRTGEQMMFKVKSSTTGIDKPSAIATSTSQELAITSSSPPTPTPSAKRNEKSPISLPPSEYPTPNPTTEPPKIKSRDEARQALAEKMSKLQNKRTCKANRKK